MKVATVSSQQATVSVNKLSSTNRIHGQFSPTRNKASRWVIATPSTRRNGYRQQGVGGVTAGQYHEQRRAR